VPRAERDGNVDYLHVGTGCGDGFADEREVGL
jgi:hypothetical protein